MSWKAYGYETAGAHHRDVNHGFANELGGLPVEQAKIAPSPYHESGIKLAA